MATGRTKPRWSRIYVDGYDLSGYTRSCGPLEQSFEEADTTTWSDTIKSYIPGQPHINLGTQNAVFDNTVTVGLHALMATAGVRHNVMIAQGIRAEPANSDPAFCGTFTQGAYQAAEEGGAVSVTIPWFGRAADATSAATYAKPWGTLAHALAARTSPTLNTAVGYDDGAGASTTRGGWMMYQVTAGNGTATLKVQDAAVNADGSFADLSGATSGVITCAAGVSGFVQLGVTATVRQFLRWQIVWGTATSVTFAMAFIRG